MIYIASDHRGFKLKEVIEKYLSENGYTVSDLGNDHYDKTDDYPEFASRVAKKVSADPKNSKGIVLCGSGIGVDIVANKFDGVRSALVSSSEQAIASRRDDDTNVLALAADYFSPDEVKELAKIWLETSFSGNDRYKRRLGEIEELEEDN
jgi:ribose 5-phosphate isomerase B